MMALGIADQIEVPVKVEKTLGISGPVQLYRCMWSPAQQRLALMNSTTRSGRREHWRVFIRGARSSHFLHTNCFRARDSRRLISWWSTYCIEDNTFEEEAGEDKLDELASRIWSSDGFMSSECFSGDSSISNVGDSAGSSKTAVYK